MWQANTSTIDARLDFQATLEGIKQARRILIVLPQRPSIDAVAASLSLYLAFGKNQKNVMIACANPLTVTYNRLFGVDKIVREIGNKNLVISFPCLEENLEKVSYNIENNQFNLVIEQKEGRERVDPKEVKYSYVGVAADMVLVVGANRLEDLGAIYESDRNFYTETQVVNINSSATGMLFGKLNIFNPQASSVSELVSQLIQQAELPVDVDLATNLLAGIESATNNLAFKTNSKTFEVLAWLMSAGAKRGHLTPSYSGPAFPAGNGRLAWGSPNLPFGASMSQAPYQAPVSQSAAPMPNQSMAMPYTPPVPLTQNGQNSAQTVKPVKSQMSPKWPPENTGTEPDKESYKPASPQPDWFKPKIFQGKTRV